MDNNNGNKCKGNAATDNAADVEEHTFNSTSTHASASLEEQGMAAPNNQPSGTPFINLSQVDADLALARTLQEQERAYMLLRMGVDGSDYGSWETGSYAHEDDFDDPNDDIDVDGEGSEIRFDGTDVEAEDDAFEVHAHDDDVGENDNENVEMDPSAFADDEAYARALQDVEEREMASRLFAFAGIHDRETDVVEEHAGIFQPQNMWEEVDQSELSYEELLALGDIAGTENRGLSASTIASLPSVIYKSQDIQNGSNESCVICRLDYEDGDALTVLSCKHSYHSECINNWLKINKVCPICSTEVSSS